MTVTRRIRSPGRARNKPLKPLRAGMPGDLGWTCGDYARVLVSTFAREAMGATRTRHSPRPLFCEAKEACTTRARHAAGSRTRIRDCVGCLKIESMTIHRVRTRATLPVVIARLDRATQYSRDADDRIERPRDVLDRPLKPDDDRFGCLKIESGSGEAVTLGTTALTPPFDNFAEHPAHLGLGLLDPRLKRRKIRCVAGPRHHAQQIFA